MTLSHRINIAGYILTQDPTVLAFFYYSLKVCDEFA